jgi:ribosomal protein L29
MKNEDMKTKSRAELETLLQTLRTKLSQLRFDLADKKLKQTSDIKKTRTLIARAMTALSAAK